MKVELDGKLQTVPLCTCGKCLVKRLRKDNFLSYPYNNALRSMYKNDFGPNSSAPDLNDNKKVYNRSKNCNLDLVYKDDIPTNKMSVHQMDYKPFKIEPEDMNPTQHEIDKAPFLGTTTYKDHYPDFGSNLQDKPPKIQLEDIHVPLRGEPNYKESYPRHPKKDYEKKDMKIVPKDNLKPFGKFNPETTTGNTFQPVDFKQPHYFNDDNKANKANFEKSQFVPAEFPPSNFESSYKRSIGNFDKSNECKLRQFLRARGKTCLEI